VLTATTDGRTLSVKSAKLGKAINALICWGVGVLFCWDGWFDTVALELEVVQPDNNAKHKIIDEKTKKPIFRFISALLK
jgi:hypothetical protein